MTTVTIDLTDNKTLTASLLQLDPGQREQLLHATRELVSADNDTEIIRFVRETIAEQYPWMDVSGKRRVDPDGTPHLAGSPTPVAVVFSTMDYDNGNFLTESGAVLFDNGDVDDLDFTGIEDVFTDEFGAVGPNYTLGVDLRTGETDGDDYAEDSIHARFGIAKPQVDATESPEPGTQVTIDLADAPASLAELDTATRTRLLDDLRNAGRADAERDLILQIRATLARERPGQAPAGVVFTAEEEINLNYLGQDALVVYTDGRTEHLAFPGLRSGLIEQYGAGEYDRSLAVDLRTGEVVHDGLDVNDGVAADVHDHFALPDPTTH